MAITINAKTSGAGGLETTADNTGNINIQSGGSTVMSISSTGVSVTGSFSQDGAVYSTQPTFRNLIINGDMRIAQRGTSASGLTSTGYQTVDRMEFQIGSLGTWTMTQDSDVPTGQGFGKSFKLACTTADASPAASDSLAVNYKMEGQDIQHLAYGTASAKSLTLSFWVKSNKTGTYINELVNTDVGKQISKSYTISSADTWEKKTITFAGDTVSGFTNDNNLSMYLRFYFGAGTDLTSGTLNTSWATTVNANRAVGQVNLADSTSNYINITGLQLEVGSTATDFEVLPYDVELARCQRYTYKLGGEISNYYADSAGGYYDANYISFGKIRFPVPMRTAPSATFTAGGGINVWRGNTTYTGFSWNIVISGNPTTRDCFIVGNKTSHGVTVDAGAMIKFEDTAANCLFSAEL